MSRMDDVIVIGGGVIGCSIAYQLAGRGLAVTVLERGRLGGEATAAAAGMLGAQAEMDETGPLFQLSRWSRSLFPQLAEELGALTGIGIGLVREGLLHLAVDEAQEQELRARAALQRAAGETAAWLDAAEAVRLEPALSRELRGALYLPSDGQVEAPQLARALAAGAALRGARLREYAQAQELLVERGRVVGVLTDDGPRYAERVVAAAGVWSGRLLSGIGAELPLAPVKGECFSVLASPGLLRRTLFTPGCYIVPKAGGRLVVGATMQPGSYDRRVSLAGIAGLMQTAQRLLPAIGEAEWERAWSGLRPQSADGLPYLGAVPGYEGLYVAAGHYRNGILLAPATGVWLAALVAGGPAEAAELLAREERQRPGAGSWAAACQAERLGAEAALG
ncbi:glycine oxidase ThiO [Paenibacillus athensensis]|uniref:glycine oxidase n=1 Tax=Paenibacillus athensensis TaxID=1967502 RepID=A0A4Y8PPY0_9BACL|nr:glycine oxidase ThiO [Paenibacillus athensensis]MCD1260524.1 glycine oxidase ThiO [Paenibacillus athensensis]